MPHLYGHNKMRILYCTIFVCCKYQVVNDRLGVQIDRTSKVKKRPDSHVAVFTCFINILQPSTKAFFNDFKIFLCLYLVEKWLNNHPFSFIILYDNSSPMINCDMNSHKPKFSITENSVLQY